MSTQASQFRALYRELEHRHSGSAPPPVTDTRKEPPRTDTMSSGYPPLDKKEVGDGYKMCVRNATRLMSDAREFRDAGRCRSAYFILSLALEELRHAVQLYEAGRSEVHDWEAWWRRYFSHANESGSTTPEIPRTGEANGRPIPATEGRVYVEFRRDDQRFVEPSEDDDSELLQLFDKEATYAEGVLEALPSHALERWELEEVVQQSPDIAPSVLYARIEERVNQEPAISEQDLLTAIARDMGMSVGDFVAGFEWWKKAAHKARVYVDLIRPDEGRFKKEKEAGRTR